MAQVWEVPLRRQENTQPWGFRLKGGADQGIPLHVEHINPSGRAASAGLKIGDYVLGIGKNSVEGYTHQQVKGEMLRAGNDLDLVVQRGDGSGTFTAAPEPAAAHAQPAPQGGAQAEPRSVVCEEPIMKFGGPTYKKVQQKTFDVMNDELPASEAGMGGKPSSIFSRNKGERSGYLNAKGSSIQKAFGES